VILYNAGMGGGDLKHGQRIAQLAIMKTRPTYLTMISEDNFNLIAQLWTTYTGTFINEHDVAMMMCLLKIARAKTGIGTRDSYIDLAGYCALAYDIKESTHGM